jgi:biopolymer transport protein ExbD
MRAYKPGLETRTDLTEDERVEKTITVKAPRSIKYGDVMKIVDAIKGAGASPIVLQLDDLSQ